MKTTWDNNFSTFFASSSYFVRQLSAVSKMQPAARCELACLVMLRDGFACDLDLQEQRGKWQSDYFAHALLRRLQV